MDDKAKEDLHTWLGERGFSGELRELEAKLHKSEIESRDRLSWNLWEGQFRSNKRIIEFLHQIFALGIKHFKHYFISADYLILGSMEFSTPRPEYAHKDTRAISVHLSWKGPEYHEYVEVRILFRYADDDIRDRYITFKV